MNSILKASVVILIVPIVAGALPLLSSAAVAQPSTADLTKQATTYQPPNNGGPSTTQGAGTR